jgi:hypothetical protein
LNVQWCVVTTENARVTPRGTAGAITWGAADHKKRFMEAAMLDDDSEGIP